MILKGAEVCRALGGKVEGNSCILDTKKLQANKTNHLNGYIVVTDWYGNHGWKKLHIITDDKGLKEIKANPLQDYIQFGAQSVDYADFDISSEISIYKDIDRIEVGKYNLTPEEENAFIEDWDVATVNYDSFFPGWGIE